MSACVDAGFIAQDRSNGSWPGGGRAVTFRDVIPTAKSTPIDVVVVGLPRFYESLLQQAFGTNSQMRVTRLGDDDSPEALALDSDSVIVVGTTAASLRRATGLIARGKRILGTIAVTDDEPRGDVYLVEPAGKNVSHHELAHVVRQVAEDGKNKSSVVARFYTPGHSRSTS